MSGRKHGLVWLPPFLVGASAAVAAEVAIGLLLYTDVGLMRSLSTVLVTELAAFGIGLWAAPGPGPGLVDRIRRAWLLCVLTFVAAAFFGTSWTFVRDLGSGALGQGVGLALMAALPLYASGSVLGGIATLEGEVGGWRRGGVGAAAALGAAAGFGVAGVLLPRSPMPSSLLIGCLVMLSLGGMVYGVVLVRRGSTVVRAERAAPTGDVRVEDRTSGTTPGTRALFEGAFLRRKLSVTDVPERPWDLALARALMPAEDQPWRVLVVGGGASSLPSTVVREHPLAEVEVLERSPAVLELAREHLDTGLEAGLSDRATVRVGNLDDLVDQANGPYDLVVVDGHALAPLGGGSGLSVRARSRLAESVAPGGALVWGPAPDAREGPPAAWQVVRLTRSGGTEQEEVILASREPFTLEREVVGFVASTGGLSPP